MTRALAASVLMGSLVAGCGLARRGAVGIECELSSECDTPLVCRLAHCRNECRTSGDCAARLACVRDEDGLGACQLLSERNCHLPTDCPTPLVCRDNRCVNECVEDRDCLGGARCTEIDGGGVCIDASSTPCVTDAECQLEEPGTFCLAGRCRLQCFTDRDCRRNWRCDVQSAICFDPFAIDAGPDAGSSPRDAGDLDGAGLDAPLIADASGPIDGGGLDTGVPGRIDSGAPPPATTCTGGPLGGVVSLDLGRQVGCAIRVDGSGVRHLHCWGAGSGYLWEAPGDFSAECATEVSGRRGADMVEVAVAADFACLRSSIGVVSCFGDNSAGALGRGVSGSGTSDTAAAPIASLTASSVRAGLGLYACATRAGMSPVCWGDDSAIQLGDPPYCGCQRPSPVAAIEAGSADTLYLGYSHTCFVTAMGGVDCFGASTAIDAGLGLTDVRNVAPGSMHTCALTGAGVSCWGENTRGQLGDGTTTSAVTPRPVLDLPAVPTEICAGDSHTCALVPGGDVWCWGDGQGADPVTHGGAHPRPALVMSGASAVRCGALFTCAITTSGTVRCFGGSRGVIGYGTGLPLAGTVEVQLGP